MTSNVFGLINFSALKVFDIFARGERAENSTSAPYGASNGKIRQNSEKRVTTLVNLLIGLIYVDYLFKSLISS